jgi:hemolysin activation/secretion protein
VFDVVESVVEENGQRSSADSLRMLRAGLDYALADQWLGDARNAVNVVSVRLSQGLPVLGATKRGAMLASRADQQPAFHKIAFDLSRTQTLFQPWDGASVALLGVIAGQYSGDVLPSAEKYFLGGNRLARGFYYGQVTGDRALAGTLEIQLNTINELELWGGPTEVSAQFYGFYDAAQTWESLGQDRGRRLRSAGMGLRVIPSPKLEIDLEAVQRLTRFPTGSGAGIAPLPGTAFYWRIVSRF